MPAIRVTALFALIVLVTAIFVQPVGTPATVSAAPAVLIHIPEAESDFPHFFNSLTNISKQFSDSADQAQSIVPEGVPSGYVYWKTIRAKVTAYEPSSRSCGESADGRTSLGDNAWQIDGCAVDPRAIPYRTYMQIPGVGVREADDTGSAMRRSWGRQRRFHIDVRFPYVHQAVKWGVKTLDVKLYRKIDSNPPGGELDS